ncbi:MULTISPECIES: precorrin-2 C(20)-methyltransferase [Moorena]|uniref:Precorrin-2 C(20)-methyltransferase n=2 Tax=Moorena producens TaxID=1155739 RepID=A0A1D9FUR7_MOOP1|nr:MULTISPECIES: precorrin-2 C(20)-methyltransferase [Moorena]NEQ18037.1 precorrin-2 C(20)-methyltransferase [Moorena sp. SIO3E2]AOY79065.1 precorrin-2 C(20)-methyltransferase [Moorena producens JHB]EGJ29079.1 precorrin-2 C20-methyltransferase [Moorena producens 3L]NEP67010.1 precorrin-2 C(20)-methyltransferase [Moorena sp. SIO3A5]NEQ07118.1 precorrin-2 C(20)-methyltransferase [Moorena sp. SIO4E2]
MKLGTLYGISVGPGDPDLITLKALRILKQAPVVAFPTGVRGKPGMAQQIVAQWLENHQVQLPLTFPYVQDTAILTQAWQLAAEQVWNYLGLGQDVAFVCEGDVSFYSTFTYLAQRLQQLHPQSLIQTVPGVSSPMATASVLGLPLTIRDQRLVVLPALYNVEELEKVLAWADVVVLLKVSSVYQQVWQVLHRHQLLENAYVVERATLPEQVIYRNLCDRPNLALPYFSLLIVKVNQ